MLKTHSGSKKRFKIKKNGDVIKAQAYRRHQQRRRNSNTKRSESGTSIMKSCDKHKIYKLMPYNL